MTSWGGGADSRLTTETSAHFALTFVTHWLSTYGWQPINMHSSQLVWKHQKTSSWGFKTGHVVTTPVSYTTRGPPSASMEVCNWTKNWCQQCWNEVLLFKVKTIEKPTVPTVNVAPGPGWTLGSGRKWARNLCLLFFKLASNQSCERSGRLWFQEWLSGGLWGPRCLHVSAVCPSKESECREWNSVSVGFTWSPARNKVLTSKPRDGERRRRAPTSEELWLETTVSSVLRMTSMLLCQTLMLTSSVWQTGSVCLSATTRG